MDYRNGIGSTCTRVIMNKFVAFPILLSLGILSMSTTMSWAGEANTHHSSVSWGHVYMCENKVYIIGSSDDGWALWNRPDVEVGTTYDGFGLYPKQGNTEIYIRQAHDKKDVVDVIVDNSEVTHDCIYLEVVKDTKR